MPPSKKPVDAYALLRDLILREQLMPNERLVEMDYAERFDTNRSNIRRAFARLAQDGLVVVEPFRGVRVRRVTAVEAVEMYEVRAALEVALVRPAVERANEADRKSLKALAQKMREALRSKDPIAVGRTSRKIREELWRISGHATGERMLASLNTRLGDIWFRGIMMPGRAEAIDEELMTVVETVCAGSVAKATRAMRRYHNGAISNLKHAIAIGRPSVSVEAT